MKKLTLTSAVFMAVAASGVYAHHPTVDIVDDETYSMIEANLEAADSPHLTMDLDTMGSAAGVVADSSAMEQSLREQAGPQMSQSGVEPPMEPVTVVDTMNLLEDVGQSISE